MNFRSGQFSNLSDSERDGVGRDFDHLDLPVLSVRWTTLRGPEKFPGTQWYRAGFSSLTSHAAGIVGFVGFQKIVVARFGWSKHVEGQLMNLILSNL